MSGKENEPRYSAVQTLSPASIWSISFIFLLSKQQNLVHPAEFRLKDDTLVILLPE